MTQSGQNEPGPEALDDLISGVSRAQLVYVCAQLRLADHLKDGPRTGDELARAVGANAGALRRVLRGLALLGVVREAEGGRYALTEMGEGLRSDAADSWRGWALLWGGAYGRAYAGLLHSVMTGETGIRHETGRDFFEYLIEHPEEQAAFDAFMRDASAPVAEAVAATYDFSDVGTVVDVAGGTGALLAAIMTRHQHMKGVLFDQPHVVARAPEVLAAAGVAERCEVVAGSFFDTPPGGGDVYLLKWVLHDWSDERARQILAACRRAMGAGARLLVIEELLPDQGQRVTDAPSVVWNDLLMLVMLGGRERTEGELRELLEGEGLQVRRVLPVPLEGRRWHILEASRA